MDNTNTELKVLKMDMQAFNVTDAALEEMSGMYMPLVVEDVNDKEGYGKVKAARSIVRSKRVDVERTRKALKKDALEYGRKIDAEAKRITSNIVTIEDHLVGQQKIVEDELARLEEVARIAKEERARARINHLIELKVQFDGRGYLFDGTHSATPSEIGEMEDEEFAEILRIATDEFKLNEEIRKEEEEKKRAEEERLEKQRQDQARIAKEQEEREAKIKADQERVAEQQRIERDDAAKEQAEKDAKIRAEQEEREAKIKAEQDRVSQEQADKEAEIKADQDRIAEQQRQEQEKIDRERRELEEQKRRDEEDRKHQAELEAAKKKAAEDAKIAAEEKARQDAWDAKIKAEREEKERIEAEQAEKERLERAERLKPDREKIEYFAHSLLALNLPQVESKEAISFVDDISCRVEHLHKVILRAAKAL